MQRENQAMKTGEHSDSRAAATCISPALADIENNPNNTESPT